MAKTRTGFAAGTGSAPIPETGPIPPRPADFLFTSNLSGVTDANRVEWASNTVAEVSHWKLYSGTAPNDETDYDNTSLWTLVTQITNTATANTYSLPDQISNRWFILVPFNSFGNAGKVAGPIENRRPGRTVTVKGYFKDLNGNAVSDGEITVKLSVSSTITSVVLTGHQRVVLSPETITPDAAGFWEILLFSSN